MVIYVLASALNLGATIFDGNELSVIRGSSARLLRASEELFDYLESTFRSRAAVGRLTVGASELVARLSPLAVPGPEPALEAPFGANRDWRQKTLRGLVQQARDTGTPATDVAQAFIESHRKRIKPEQAAAKVGSVTAQIAWHVARRAAEDAVPGESDIADAVEAFFALPQQRKLRHFCFDHVCHTQAGGERLSDVLAVLYSRLRERQLQSPTLPLPEVITPMPPAAKAFCAYTLGRRPASPGAEVRDRPMSLSAAERRTDGTRQKQLFYEAQLRRSRKAATALANADAEQRLAAVERRLKSEKIVFAHDFEAIVREPPDGLPPNAQNKLAVLFMDGNNFGKMRAECANLEDRRGAFDRYQAFCLALEQNGGLILAGLLDWMLNEETTFIGTNEKSQRYLRFETLMFGGDDIGFVMPAWAAFALLGQLADIMRGLRVPDAQGGAQPVAFGIGVAIADRRSPIRELRGVASILSDAAKETCRSRSIVHMMALEGLDHADLDPSRLRWELFGAAGDGGSKAFGLALNDWPKILEAFDEIGRKVGRSQLHKWYRKAEEPVTDGQPCLLRRPGDDREVEKFLTRFDERLGELGASADAREALTGGSPLLAAGAKTWPLLPLHHLLTLADYAEASVTAAAGGRAAA